MKNTCSVLFFFAIVLMIGCVSGPMFYSRPRITPPQEVTRSDVAPAGRTFHLPGDVDLELIGVGTGTFVMGYVGPFMHGASYDTGHKVTLTRPFWLGRFELTRAQYRAIMGDVALQEYDKQRHCPAYATDEFPIDNLLWRDAITVCDRLNQLFVNEIPAGYYFSLPTEAQWEYACRAGSTGSFNDGSPIALVEERGREITYYRASEYSDALGDLGWYKGNSEGKIHQVGEKQPNAWGFFDMHGNVDEWVLDEWDLYAADTVADEVLQNVIDPFCARSTSSHMKGHHVTRGGNRHIGAQMCTCWYRSQRSDEITYKGETVESRFGAGMRIALIQRACPRVDSDKRAFSIREFNAELKERHAKFNRDLNLQMFASFVIIGLSTAAEVAGQIDAARNSNAANPLTTSSGGSGFGTIQGPTSLAEGKSASYKLYVGGRRIDSGVSWSTSTSCLIVSGHGSYASVMAKNPPVKSGSTKAQLRATYNGKTYSKWITVQKTGIFADSNRLSK